MITCVAVAPDGRTKIAAQVNVIALHKDKLMKVLTPTELFCTF